MHPRTRARLCALRSLPLVEESDSGLNTILDELRTPPESLAFARELASGATRWRSRLDWTLAPLLKKPLEKLDAPVRAALRLALYERIVLATPASAVANEYAEMMREVKLKSAVGFVNAIARRLPDAWRESPPQVKNAAKYLSLETAHPEWMCARWIERLGFESALALCQADNQIAPTDLRINTARVERAQVLEVLQSRGILAHETPLSPHGMRIARAVRAQDEAPREAPSSPWQWPEWKDGALLAQDEAAQMVALALDAGEGERILDVASAPGGKTTHLAQIAGKGTRILAADRSGERLGKVRENVARLQLKNVDFLAADALQVLERIEKGELALFNRVLLDAPCSGTGTLRRRPDAKWRKSIENIEQLCVLQSELIGIAAACVQPGGLLAYSTCSLEEEENAGQIREFLKRNVGWQIEAPSTRFVSAETWQKLSAAPDLEGAIATNPGRDGCDGMFCCVLRRV
jgi:16S rRNA (cytosine967-C5)-methyltransferase